MSSDHSRSIQRDTTERAAFTPVERCVELLLQDYLQQLRALKHPSPSVRTYARAVIPEMWALLAPYYEHGTEGIRRRKPEGRSAAQAKTSRFSNQQGRREPRYGKFEHTQSLPRDDGMLPPSKSLKEKPVTPRRRAAMATTEQQTHRSVLEVPRPPDVSSMSTPSQPLAAPVLPKAQDPPSVIPAHNTSPQITGVSLELEDDLLDVPKPEFWIHRRPDPWVSEQTRARLAANKKRRPSTYINMYGRLTRPISLESSNASFNGGSPAHARLRKKVYSASDFSIPPDPMDDGVEKRSLAQRLKDKLRAAHVLKAVPENP
ncbi:hypothetical protein HDZ31DRAFT_65365 [Schizophyllum fasciatum]